MSAIGNTQRIYTWWLAVVLFACGIAFGWVARADDVASDPDNPFATSEEKAAAAPFRTWNDNSGKFHIEAKLLRLEDGQVVLHRRDDKEISVPLDKLCDADQKYVAKFTASNSAPTAEKPAAGGVDAAPVPDTTRPKLTATDFTAARPLDLTGSAEWKYLPDLALAGDKLPASRVPLKPVDFFDRLQSILLLPKEKKAFVIFYNDFKTHVSQVQACNLVSGQLDTAAVFARDETPIDISPDGALVLARVERAGSDDNKLSELRLYGRDGNKVKPIQGWKPFIAPTSPEHEVDTEISWAAFSDAHHVLTLSSFGQLVYWEVPNVRPVWSTTVAFGTQPTFSAGRKYLALLTKTESAGNFSAGHPLGRQLPMTRSTSGISILNVADGTEAGHLSIDEEPGPRAAVALSDDGARLALWQMGRIRVWDMQSHDMVRDFGFSQQLPLPFPQTLVWTTDNHLLLNNSILVDVERRIPIWSYDHMQEATAVRDGKVWYLEDGAKGSMVLACATVPNKNVLDSVAGYKPEDLLVFHPGMEVSIDLQINGDADEMDGIRNTIEERLMKNGMKVTADSKVKLLGTVEPGKTVTVRYHSWGMPPFSAQEHEVNTEVLTLSLQINGESVWKYESTTSPPSFLRLQEGETIDQALERVMKQQEDNLPKRWSSIWIPTYLARIPGSLLEGEKPQLPQPKAKPSRERTT
ncbi:MAG TPA: SHD1 domain-containing protein [Pirellulales bacterium]|nr:SHD1 domain-containing protein [Pirellulales bacterium]